MSKLDGCSQYAITLSVRNLMQSITTTEQQLEVLRDDAGGDVFESSLMHFWT